MVKQIFELSFYWARESTGKHSGMATCKSCTSLAGRKGEKKRFRKASDKCCIVASFTNKGIFQLRDFPIHVDKLNSGYDCRTLESQEAACQEQGCWPITSMHVKLKLTFHVKLAELRANHNSKSQSQARSWFLPCSLKIHTAFAQARLHRCKSHSRTKCSIFPGRQAFSG